MFDYDNWIEVWDARLDQAAVYRKYMEDDAVMARYQFQQGNDHDALDNLISAVYQCWKFADRLVPWTPKVSGMWRFKDLAAGIRDDFTEMCNGGVTMEAMNAAMITATEDEYKYFIGLVDAFRIALWNKPFNSEYYAALARGFTGGF